MPVIRLIPHRLSFLIIHQGYEDENGDWHEGTEEWSDPIDCHAVASGPADLIRYADGTTDRYSYTIGRLKPDCREFSIGEKVKLEIGDWVREFQVKGFHRYQLQSKIWV